MAGFLCWFQTIDVAVVLERLRLRAENNTFPDGKDIVHIGYWPEGQRAAALRPIGAFDPVTGRHPGDNSLSGAVTIEGSGKRFATLEEAVRNAPDGATLLLEGRLLCDKLSTPIGQELHLRAAPGERPVIIGVTPGSHALFINGPGTARGIRFERRGSTAEAVPVLLWRGHGAGFLMEDCEIVSLPWRNATGHAGLGISEATGLTLRRCVFQVPGGNALSGGTGVDRVELEDCAIIAANVMARRTASGPVARTGMSAQRCVFLAERMVAGVSGYRFDPVDLTLEQCLLDVDEVLLALPDIEASALPALVTWEGVGNIHRPGTPVLRTFRDRGPEGFHPVLAADFASLRGLGVRVDHTGMMERAMFDPARLSGTVSPATLLAAMDETLDTPAVSALRGLAGFAASGDGGSDEARPLGEAPSE